MTYRDERDALRERVETLEEDLGEAQRKIAEQKANEEKRARVELIESRMNEARRELDLLSRELSDLRGTPAQVPQKTSYRPLVFACGLLTIAMGVAGFFVASRSAPPAPVQQPRGKLAEVVAPVPPPTPEPTPEPAPEPSPPEPSRPMRTAKTKFTAKVTNASGMGPKVGAKCLVLAALESDGEKGRVQDISVNCGGLSIYDSSDKLEGMSMNSAGMAELPGKVSGTQTYAIRYSDTGARSGPRTQISLDTTRGAGAVWSDVVPIFRVELSVPQESEPVTGARLIDKGDKAQP